MPKIISIIEYNGAVLNSFSFQLVLCRCNLYSNSVEWSINAHFYLIAFFFKTELWEWSESRKFCLQYHIL